LSIYLTDDAEMRDMNRQWRGLDKPTDVLSFPQLEPDELATVGADEPIPLGDIVISIPTARRQADENDHPVGEELEWLLAHGLLHLLGYDHEKSPDHARSQRLKERHLLRKLRAS
jgi:probable rRNA maturation factor